MLIKKPNQVSFCQIYLIIVQYLQKLCLSLKIVPTLPPIKMVRKITPEKIERLKDKLNSLSWDEVLVANDVNTSYDKFMHILVSSLNECIPLVKCISNRKRQPRNPWVSKSLLRSINRKINLYYKYRANPTDSLRAKYNKYKNTLTTLLRSEKISIALHSSN